MFILSTAVAGFVDEARVVAKDVLGNFSED
jgi:hypothetical protein